MATPAFPDCGCTARITRDSDAQAWYVVSIVPGHWISHSMDFLPVANVYRHAPPSPTDRYPDGISATAAALGLLEASHAMPHVHRCEYIGGCETPGEPEADEAGYVMYRCPNHSYMIQVLERAYHQDGDAWGPQPGC